jgi:hypothetical protein
LSVATGWQFSLTPWAQETSGRIAGL